MVFISSLEFIILLDLLNKKVKDQCLNLKLFYHPLTVHSKQHINRTEKNIYICHANQSGPAD